MAANSIEMIQIPLSSGRSRDFATWWCLTNSHVRIKTYSNISAPPARPTLQAAAGSGPGPPERERYVLTWAGYELDIVSDFNLSGGCFPVFLNRFYKKKQTVHDF